MQITALRDDVLRVRVGANGQLPEDASWAALPDARSATVPVTPDSNATSVGFKTAKLRVTVKKDPLELKVTDLDGHVIAEDFPGRPIEFHGSSFRVYMKSRDGRALFWPGRQAGAAGPSQRGVYRLEYGCLRVAGIDRSDLQVDSLLHYVSQGEVGRHFPRQYVAHEL